MVLFFLIGCDSSNQEFNPFDSDFHFHRNFDRSEYDTIVIECGYWNLTKQNGILSTYYQFFADNKQVVGKGFSLTIDELQLEDSSSDQKIKMLISKNPIDVNQLKTGLSVFPVKEIKIKPDTSIFLRVEIIDNHDSLHYAWIEPYPSQGKLYRQLVFFNGGK